MKNYLNAAISQCDLKTSFTHWVFAQHCLCALSPKASWITSYPWRGHPLSGSFLSAGAEAYDQSLTSGPWGQSPCLLFLQCSGYKVPEPCSMKSLPPQFYNAFLALLLMFLILPLSSFVGLFPPISSPGICSLVSPKPAFTQSFHMPGDPFLIPVISLEKS